MRFLLITASLLAVSCWLPAASAQQRVLMQGNGKLAIVNAQNKVEWEMPWGGIYDVHVLANGNIMVQRGSTEVVEIDRETKKVVWSYNSAKSNGNEGKRLEVHSFQPLDNGNVLIAESGTSRLIEINRAGEIQAEIPLTVSESQPHRDTRLVRKLASGNYLVAQENDGVVREYDSKANVVWEYAVPLFGQTPKGGHGPEAFGNHLFAALRLKNGNTLIATGNGHSVLEVTPEKKIVWKLGQNDLPGITLAWVTTLEVLPNGNYMIGNCHAGPENPLLVEVDPKSKKAIWTFDRYDLFGNSASNSQLLNVKGDVIR